MSRLSERPLVCYVTNRRALGESEHERRVRLLTLVAAAARGGADLVQVREHDLDGATLARLVHACLDCVAGTTCRVLVNDRVDVAIATGAGGLHLGGESIPVSRARELLGPLPLIGRSLHSVREVRALDDEPGADYLLFGTVFPSASKGAGVRATGPETLGEAVRATALPVLAIGGITLERVGAIAAAGAAGFAAIGLFQSSDPDELGAVISAARQKFDTSGDPS
jgi:thiamine-phosphate pyrophosphorylase